MHFEGERLVRAPRQMVWAYLLDANKVAACAPGFKGMEILGPDHFKPTVGVGIGAVKATFTLDVHLVEINEPEHVAMTGRGVASDSATDLRGVMDLTEESDSSTRMRWTAEVNVTGKIANMGARLLQGTANKLTERFFTCVSTKLEAQSAAAGAAVPEASPASVPAAGGGEEM
jgi:carbon monoxide dehydrogenase subunit G